MSYAHTQKGPWYLLLAAVAAASAAGGWALRQDTAAMTICWSVAAVLILVSFCFVHLTVRDEGDALAIRFGPVPLFSTRLRYEEITSVQRDHTIVLDGWGMHWIPGRGATYNIWGFDCVRLAVGRRTIRIGTDDADGLLHFLRARLGKQGERSASS